MFSAYGLLSGLDWATASIQVLIYEVLTLLLNTVYCGVDERHDTHTHTFRVTALFTAGPQLPVSQLYHGLRAVAFGRSRSWSSESPLLDQ